MSLKHSTLKEAISSVKKVNQWAITEQLNIYVLTDIQGEAQSGYKRHSRKLHQIVSNFIENINILI